MPGGDRTGPSGTGPMTGRAAGYCTGYPAPGYAYPMRGYGRGFGRGWGRGGGRGWGRGFCRGWYAYPPVAIVPPVNPQVNASTTAQQLPEQEVAALDNYQKNLAAEKADLEQELEGVKARIEELKAKQASQ
jgi:ABC-type Zn uptake system ZnuABC Zn-binding protein ZnuA